MELIRGIIAAPVLPMTEEFEVDWKGLRNDLRWLRGLVPRAGAAVEHGMPAGDSWGAVTETGGMAWS